MNRCSPIATLHRPIARWPASRSARVTMPTGLAKSTIHAPGAARRSTSAARSRTTGTVRSALASPPAPVVSWPRQPHRPGTVSSCSRASWPPTRSWTSTASAPSRAADRSAVRVSRPAQPPWSRMRRANAPTTSSRSALGSSSTSSETGRSAVRRAMPDTSSGVYVEPPPTTTTFIASLSRRDHFTPVKVTPCTNAFCAAKNSAMTGSMNSTVAAIVRFHCTWCWPRRLASATETVQALEFSPA